MAESRRQAPPPSQALSTHIGQASKTTRPVRLCEGASTARLRGSMWQKVKPKLSWSAESAPMTNRSKWSLKRPASSWNRQSPRNGRSDFSSKKERQNTEGQKSARGVKDLDQQRKRWGQERLLRLSCLTPESRNPFEFDKPSRPNVAHYAVEPRFDRTFRACISTSGFDCELRDLPHLIRRRPSIRSIRWCEDEWLGLGSCISSARSCDHSMLQKEQL